MTPVAARPLLRGALALSAVVALTLIGGTTPATAMSDYPSWQDVQNARTSESGKQAQISELQALITSLTTEVRAAEVLATQRSGEYEKAQGKLDEATYRASTLQTEAASAAERALESGRTAGQLARMMARTGASSPTMMILMDTSAIDDLLSRLASMGKLTERMSVISQQADADRNTADALTEQAQLAQSLLGELATQAEDALTAAVAAREDANRKLIERQTNETTMHAQLAVLTENRAATEVDYEKGEAARRAAEVARRAGNGGLDSGQLSGQGWALPVSGRISDPFGPRPNRPVSGVNPFHSGTDIAATCGQPVYAATGGTVVYADWLGSYGLWVLIDHGNGVQTGYAHNSALLVSPGQWVAAGANITEVGTTGASTGCHSHFEVRLNGARIDPDPFMSNRGINLG